MRKDRNLGHTGYDSHPEALVQVCVPFGESTTKVLVLKVTATMIYCKRPLLVVMPHFSNSSLHPAKLLKSLALSTLE